ncbi:12728_t:CDS:1, partial [Cetraspora pellucida]
ERDKITVPRFQSGRNEVASWKICVRENKKTALLAKRLKNRQLEVKLTHEAQ